MMLHGEALPVLVGAIALGIVHGIEPGHGWPVAASYALDQSNKWLYGLASSLLIGIGHLISSLAMVGVFFYAKSYFQLTQVNEPISTLGGITIGGPVSIVAGVLLIGLGVREYTHGHSHQHEDEHGHSHGHDHDTQTEGRSGRHDHATPSTQEHSSDGLLTRVNTRLRGIGGHSHEHGADPATDADRGLLGIAWFAFVLGFAHEEEFEIIGLCAGSTYCLELMTAYALTVIVGIVGLTMLLIAGYQEYEETVEKYTPYLPLFSATVLVVMGLGFIAGVF
jgi:ABC-type nickel/cobalt efflux system permease component RcnA